MSTKRKKQFLAISVFIVTIALSAVVFALRDTISAFSQYGYLGLFLISFASSASILFPLPGALLVIAGGSALNPLLIAPIVGLGETLGEMVGFGLGKSSAQLIDSEMHRYKKIKQFLEKYGIGAVFVGAAIPNPFFDLLGISAGALHIPLKKFMISCFLGKMTKSFFLAQFGNVLA